MNTMPGKLVPAPCGSRMFMRMRCTSPVDGRFASISMGRLVTLYVPTPGNGSGESNVTCVSAVSVAKVCARGSFCVGMRVLFEATMRMPSRMMKMGRLTISRLPRLKALACCTSDVRC